MKHTFFLLIIGVALLGCQGSGVKDAGTSGNSNSGSEVSPENLVSFSIDVEGMTCTGCENSVERSLKSMDGVVSAKASHETGKTTVSFDKSILTPESIEENINSGGYRVTSITPDN